MTDEILGHELEEWFPMEPTMGPPLPKWLGIFWPWYKPTVPPTVYTCPYCGATFSSDADLQAHIQAVHPGQPPVYTCPSCGMTFASQAELDSHILSAHPPVIYTCSICGATFASQAELDAHIQAVHGAPPAMANLSGTVSDKGTSQPIAGGALAIYMTSISTITDQAGHYEFLGLPVGTYVITVEASGYESFAANIQLVEGNNTLDIALDPVSIYPPTPPGTAQIKSLKVRANFAGGYVESEVVIDNQTGQAYRLNIPGADFFYVNAWVENQYIGIRIFRMNVGDIVPTGISVWHGSESMETAIYAGVGEGTVCIADCHFVENQSFRGILSSSWQEWVEIPYQEPPQPPEIPGVPPGPII